jgi:4-carboxymuconolactone decarboxylase
VLRFTDDVVRNVKAADGVFDDVAARLTNQQLTELLILIGYYMMVSRFLENTGVEIEDTPAA